MDPAKLLFFFKHWYQPRVGASLTRKFDFNFKNVDEGNGKFL